jgi:hypothetical protein
VRIRADELDRDAVNAMRDACDEIGFVATALERPDLVTVDIDGRRLTLSIHGATLVTPDRVATLTNRSIPDGAVPVLVGDKILGDARPELESAGWGWLDRRGRIRLRSAGVLVDAEVDAAPRSAPRRRPSAALASHGAQELAVSLLLDPDDPPGVRAIARRGGFAPSTISRALTELRDLGLVRRDGRPVVPDLFWALADQWAPTWYALADRLDLSDARLQPLVTNVDDADQPGAAVTDTRAASAWKAPVVASGTAPVSLYVTDRPMLDRVLEQAGRASRGVDRVAVAPVRSALSHRFVRAGEPWPVVHPLVVALDLAADRARGHQILDEWTPEEVPRVW